MRSIEDRDCFWVVLEVFWGFSGVVRGCSGEFGCSGGVLGKFCGCLGGVLGVFWGAHLRSYSKNKDSNNKKIQELEIQLSNQKNLIRVIGVVIILSVVIMLITS